MHLFSKSVSREIAARFIVIFLERLRLTIALEQFPRECLSSSEMLRGNVPIMELYTELYCTWSYTRSYTWRHTCMLKFSWSVFLLFTNVELDVHSCELKAQKKKKKVKLSFSVCIQPCLCSLYLSPMSKIPKSKVELIVVENLQIN